MRSLKQKTKENISKRTGIPYERLCSMDVEEIHTALERKLGKPLPLKSSSDWRLQGRGDVLLGRLSQTSDIDARLAVIASVTR